MTGSLVAGVDVGGTKAAALVVDEAGDTRGRAVQPMAGRSATGIEPIVAAVRGALAAAGASDGDLGAIGVGVPGRIDSAAGIVVLVTLSAEASSIAVLAVGVGVLVAVLAFDVAVFRWAVRVSSKLDASRMLVTEKVFGFLLAALGVQLVLNGLSDVGVIHLTTGH